ncbi:MAG: elongation factor G, partial [Candidatus Veblenbacteria bacterium]|nr:elongation factor G [Candidatus Veblenbacteria bacterium]
EWDDGEVPEDMKDKVEEYRHKLVEAIAENDEQLLAMYLEGKEIPVPDLKRTLRQACIANKLVPVFCGSALKNRGVQFMLDGVVDYLPSPLEVAAIKAHDPKTGEVMERHASDSEPFTALAFKIATDPFVGKLAFFSFYSGSLKDCSYGLNASTGEKERISRIVRLHANSREDVTEVFAGEIAAAVGLKATTTGNTLCDVDHPVLLESIVFPEPVISLAIEPKTKVDQDKMGVALQKLAEEDPTFRVRSNEETGQLIIWGMGELHLEIIVERMKREFKVEANVGKPQVAYKETVTRAAQAEGKYIRQTGGHGQYGHCWLRVEPQTEKGKGFEFLDEVRGGVIPREFIKPIEKGVIEATENGVLAGYPVVDVRVAVYDGSYHDVDSSEAAFKIAGSIAFQAAFKQAGPVILEPVMKVEVIMPEVNMGDVIGDLNSKRGQIKEMRERGGLRVVDAEVPLSEMFGYATNLRSMTQGRGSYTMEFDHYAQVPRHIAEEIIGDGKTGR